MTSHSNVAACIMFSSNKMHSNPFQLDSTVQREWDGSILCIKSVYTKAWKKIMMQHSNRNTNSKRNKIEVYRSKFFFLCHGSFFLHSTWLACIRHVRDEQDEEENIFFIGFLFECRKKREIHRYAKPLWNLSAFSHEY